MTRPKTLRLVDAIPSVKWFKPTGIKMCDLEEVSLTFDEIEAVRLADLESLYQEQVAERMGVSRQTVGRILVAARHKIAEALVNGKAIRLEGGQIQYRQPEGLDAVDAAVARRLSAEQIEHPTRIAITAAGPDLDSNVSLRFGRAHYFIIIHLDSGMITALSNKGSEKTEKGVGVRNFQRVIDAGAEVIITGRIGQKVARMLSASGVRAFLVDGGTVREAFDAYKRENPVPVAIEEQV